MGRGGVVGSQSPTQLSLKTQERKGCFPAGKGGEREPPVIPIKRPAATAPKRQTSPARPPPSRDATHAAGDGDGDGAGVRRGRPHRPLRAGNASLPDHPPRLRSIRPLIPRPPLPCSRIPHSCSTRRFLARAPSRRCILSFPLGRLTPGSDSGPFDFARSIKDPVFTRSMPLEGIVS